MSEQVDDISKFKQEAMTVLKDADLDPELKKLLVEKLFDERNQRRTASLAQKQFWHNTPLVVALVGTITIAANAISGLVLSKDNAENTARLKQIESQLEEQGKSADASRETTKEERAFAYKIIEQELAKSGDMEGRAKVLLFLVRAGVLNSLNREELEKMALNDLKTLGKGSESVGIPPTLGTGIPAYDLMLPDANPTQTKAATRLLSIAVGEINNDVEENASPDTIRKYWSAIPGPLAETIDPAMPWSAVFIAWLLKQAGNPDSIQLAATHFIMWGSSVEKGIAFKSGERAVLPGDLVFLARTPEDVAKFVDPRGQIPSGTSGVVYSITGTKLSIITGNMANAVRLVERELNDPRIVGFVRIGSGPAGDIAEGGAPPNPN
ncbi:DUF2272 domain-containing protein [Dongia deserti]|uniref:DUF2272 domain-containing protein n=1 Tax=Dongia deserti TaxID=2268030 RepID=UPI0013C4B498|nr:DUF2272 domain-containing protein [Dongia deserti]